MNRLPTARSNALRPGTASRQAASLNNAGKPPGTASRLAMGTRAGNRPGMPLATGAMHLQVEDRPMTQQGLGGIKTGNKAMTRVVQDRTYYLGILRSKMSEILSEINKLKRETTETAEEQSTYLTYEKTAEALAEEIKNQQALMGDYNMLLEKLNTNSNVQDIQRDYEELKAKNDYEAKTMENIFAQKQAKEKIIKDLSIELEQEKQMAESLVSDMNHDMRQKYMNFKNTNDQLLKQLEQQQQEIDELNRKKADFDDELSMSQVKQEAVRLYEQLHGIEAKRDALQAEMTAEGSPQEQRERLLNQVKQDNQEIASMERQIHDMTEKLHSVQEEITQLEQDLEENNGEQNQKYQELKKRELQMNEFLQNFGSSKQTEEDRIHQYEQNIVLMLENMNRKIQRSSHLPTPAELATMKDDLAFKAHEMVKSEATAQSLVGERGRLKADLMKIETLSAKITEERKETMEKMSKMKQELIIFNDLDKLKQDSALKKENLEKDKVRLTKKKENVKLELEEKTKNYNTEKAQLQENETYTTLTNLEQKWQHLEQNNFVMKEFIAAKTSETDYTPIHHEVKNMMGEYNEKLKV